MKKSILILLSVLGTSIHGQTLSETVDYINNNLRPIPVKTDVTIQKDGTFIVNEHPKSPDKVYSKCNLKKLDITEVVKATGKNEVGEYKIVLDCKTTNCVDYYWTYEGVEKNKMETCIVFYFHDIETGQKVRKALLHAQKMVMKNKDAFGN